MKRLLTLLMFALITQAALSQKTVPDSMMYGGVMRHLRVYIPAKRNCALIIHLHGYGSSSSVDQTFTNYMPVADTAGFLVAYPDGLTDSTGHQYWNVGWPFLPNKANDVGFLSALIDTVCRRYKTDPNAVFASGLSNGGFMCHKLACELSKKIAAIASVGGGTTSTEYVLCAPTRAVPVLEVHGTADATIPYTGSTGFYDYVNVDTVVKHSVTLSGCNPTPVHNFLPHNVATTNGSTVDHYVYTGGLLGATCELYRINGGQHIEWAGVAGNFDFNASREIWRFFRNYRVANCALLGLPGTSSEAESVSCNPNPFTTELVLSIQKRGLQDAAIRIYNAAGQCVYTAEAQLLNGACVKRISIGHLPVGIYVLELTTDGTRTLKKIVKQ